MTRIVALGDSTTHCVGKSGVTEKTAWRTLVAEELGQGLSQPVEVINAGVNADVTPLVVGRLRRDVLDHKPDWVVVMLGTNDAGYFRPPDGVADTPRVPVGEFEAHMRHIVERIRSVGAGVVVCTSVPMSHHYGLRHLPAYEENGLNYLVEEYARVTRQIADAFGAPLADVYRAFLGHEWWDDLIPDGIHPNPRGQRLIADAIVPVLERAIGAHA